MKTAAAMDLGSNTLRLLVAQMGSSEPVAWLALDRDLATPRLGKGLKPGASLNPEAKVAARQAAAFFVQRARDIGAQEIFLGATQACREARDGAAFVNELGRELGLSKARVLSGPEEGRLSRLGVLSRLEGPPAGAFLADVGGGSTELIVLGPGEGQVISLALGAVSLTEALLTHDPPTHFELASLDQAVQRGLQGLEAFGGRKTTRLVATAGTAATLASLHLGLTSYEPERINNQPIRLEDLEAQAAYLAEMPLDKRRRVPGLEPERADIILAGLAILKGLTRYFSLKEITIMDAGLLEGIFLDGLNIAA